ncbi:MAG: 3-deoxy-D-manno-octulosonic acid transferase [Candidatus Coatesbacteria bacterium]|nr:3-deoxy-D-manno-octulosonic acid transferase [Candidatus Coatesbacteria bacterium]
MLFLYNLALQIALVIFSPIIIPIVLFKKKYRTNIVPRLAVFRRETMAAAKAFKQRPILIHAVSVGEVGVAMPIIKALEHLNIPLVLSTITVTGQAFARERLNGEATVVYLPLDIPFMVRRFLKLINPRCVVIVETELWPNFINEAAKAGIPLALVNGRISDKSIKGYRMARSLGRRLLPKFTTILVQTERDAQRIVEIGAEEEVVKVAGTVKFDQPLKKLEPGERELIADRFGFAPDRRLIVCGSTFPHEEGLLLDVFLQLRKEYPNLGIIIAPRHVQRGDTIAGLAAERNIQFAQRSKETSTSRGYDLLILDTMGELKDAYAIAEIAYVGKSLSKEIAGGQNPIEPASYGVPVLFGPNMQNFRAVAESLVSAGAAILVADEQELLWRMSGLLKEPALRERMARAAEETITANRGATELIVRSLEESGLLDDAGRSL